MSELIKMMNELNRVVDIVFCVCVLWVQKYMSKKKIFFLCSI